MSFVMWLFSLPTPTPTRVVEYISQLDFGFTHVPYLNYWNVRRYNGNKGLRIVQAVGLALLHFNHLHARTKSRQALRFLEEDRKHTEHNQSPHP